jgi:uncharacterized protein (TIGR02246 family)
MKKIYLMAAIFVAAFAVTVGCKQTEAAAAPVAKPEFDMVAAKTEVQTQNEAFMVALNNGDAMGLANCYTQDAKFMQPNGEAVSGRENIQKLFSEWFKAGAMPTFSMKDVDMWGDENMLVVENQWTFTAEGGKQVDSGKSLELWQKEDGKWKLHRDCYNSNMPVKPAAK